MRAFQTLLIIALVVTTLSGCVSRRSEFVETETNPTTLTEENSVVLTDELGAFSIRAPKGFTLQKDLEEGGARLLHLQAGSSEDGVISMFIEETPNSVATAVGLLSSSEGAVEVKREPVTIAGLHGMKLVMNLVEAKQNNVPYYFLSAGEGKKTYVFSLPVGKPWAPFQSAVESFQVTQ
jgi:hypothetical protein